MLDSVSSNKCQLLFPNVKIDRNSRGLYKLWHRASELKSCFELEPPATRTLKECKWIDLSGDILLHCKWLNTLDSLVFIWSIHPIKIEVEPDENIFSMPNFLEKGILNLVLNFYSARVATIFRMWKFMTFSWLFMSKIGNIHDFLRDMLRTQLHFWMYTRVHNGMCVHKSTRPTFLRRQWKHSQSDFDILITFRHPFIRLCSSSIPYKT